jgi:hypothetical protein
MSESFLDESSEDVATNSETNNADIIKRSDSEHDIKVGVLMHIHIICLGQIGGDEAVSRSL